MPSARESLTLPRVRALVDMRFLRSSRSEPPAHRRTEASRDRTVRGPAGYRLRSPRAPDVAAARRPGPLQANDKDSRTRDRFPVLLEALQQAPFPPAGH